MRSTQITFERAADLAGRGKTPSIELAMLLYGLQQRQPEEFRRFYEEEHVSRRKAFYLAEVGRCLAPLRLPLQRLEAIGWSKVQIISKRLNARNADVLLKQAETYSARALSAHLRDGGSVEPGRTVLLRLHPRDYGVFEKALLGNGAAKVGRGLHDKEKAIMKIVRQVLKRSLTRT